MIYTLLLLMVAASADCLVYKWKDTSGTVHYTNKEYEIPSRYRSRVKTPYPELADLSSGQPVSTVPQTLPQTLPQTVPQPVPQTRTLTPPPDMAIQPKTGNSGAPPQKEFRRKRGPSKDDD